MSTFDQKTIDAMLADAAGLEKELRKGEEAQWYGFTTLYGEDCVCHIKGLVAEVTRLQRYERAIASLAAQIICPAQTAEEMVDKILKDKLRCSKCGREYTGDGTLCEKCETEPGIL